jgi:hypothetical protein
VGFDGVACRLVQFRERKRCAQAEAARALLLRHGDCSLERFLGKGGTGGIALQQDFPANAMHG